MFGNLLGIALPGAALGVAITAQIVTGMTDWQLLVIAFAAGGLVLQQRQILKEMVTKKDLLEFEIRMNHEFQTKEGCEDTHKNMKGKAARA